MSQRFNKFEKRILIAAALLCCLFSYMLYDDSWLDFDQYNRNLKEVGVVLKRSNDVRIKNAKQFIWKKVSEKSILHQGDSLFTGAGSETTLVFTDGSKLVVHENTLISFNFSDDPKDPNFKFKILTGSVVLNEKTIPTPKIVDLTKQISAQEANKKASSPKIIFPAKNQSFKIDFDENGNAISSKQIKYKWKSFHKNATFEYEMAYDKNFSEPIFSNEVDSSEAISPNLAAAKYFLRVREKINGVTSSWSATVPFIIGENRPTPLSPPILASKNINYRVPSPDLPTFAWEKVNGADQYIFEISKTPEFSDAVSLPLQQLQYRWKKYDKGNFYYRVYAAKKNGYRGSPSETGQILISVSRPVLAPVEPKTVFGKTPEDLGDPQEFKVEWTGLPLASSYQIQVSEDESFAKPLQYESRDPASIVNVPKPGNYKWRVRPLSSSGAPLTSFSDMGSLQYKLTVPLSQPILLEPAEDMTLFFQNNLKPIFWLEWQSVRQADLYKIEIAKDTDFNQIVLSEQIKNTRLLIKEKLPLGKLYWRVKAEGEGRSSHWSQTRRMSVYAGKSARIHQMDED